MQKQPSWLCQEQHYPAKGYIICISACVMSATGYVLTKLITDHVDKVAFSRCEL